MRFSRSKKIICMLLIALMLIPSVLSSISPITADANEITEESVTAVESSETKHLEVNSDLKIFYENEQIELLEIYEHEKKEIKVRGANIDAAFQWQIYVAGDINNWVDIYDAKKDTLGVSLALLSGAMDSTETTMLRCKISYDDLETITPVVNVKITKTPAEVFAEDVLIDEAVIPDEVIELTETAPEFITVKINYERWEYVYSEITDEDVLTNVGQAFSPYIASILYNGDLKTTVKFPTIVGFEPYLGDATTPSTELELNLTGIKEDKIYTVNYKPKEVPYEVHYYFQNIYDDLYVEDETKTLRTKGQTGKKPELGLNETFEGFTNLYYQPDTIAADGSTIFEVYYERNYYLMEFDCDGGYGANTIYVRHGTYISVPNPIKTGYEFKGWDLISTTEGEETIPDTDNNIIALPTEMPMYHSTYKAVWKEIETSYTIVYWAADLKKDGFPTTYSYFGQQKVENIMSATELTPSVVGKNNPIVRSDGEHNYYLYDEAATIAQNSKAGVEQKVIVEGDGSTIINVYYKRKIFEIRYIIARLDGGDFQVANSTGGGFGKTDVSWTDVVSLPSVTTGYSIKTENLQTPNSWGGTATHEYYYISVRAEYGASIEGIWPDANVGSVFHERNGWGDSNATYYWGSWAAQPGTPYRDHGDSQHANIVGPYPYMSREMINENYLNNDDYEEYDSTTGETYYVAQHMVAWWSNGGNVVNHAYHVYFEDLDDVFDVTYSGTKYDLEKTLVFTCAHNGSTRVDPFDYIGFECANYDKSSQGNSSSFGRDEGKCPEYDSTNPHGYCNYFYYTRKEYKLSYYNYNNDSDAPAFKMLKYGALLVNPGTPEYPKGIEPGAYAFDGWYTTSNFYPGTKIENWNMTMPAGDMTLYANWVPIVRNVNFYGLYTDVGTDNYWQPDEENLITYPIKVTHGNLLGTTYNYVPQREGYTFIGWFYFDENGKKKFAPDSMAVIRDLELFAEWKSSTPTTYKIKYEAWDYDSQTLLDEEIAEQLDGYSTAGKTVTFKAKGADLLFNKNSEGKPNYKEKWFPETSSHSILMDSNSANNEFAFKYYTKEYINYKVIYKDRITGEILGETDPIKTYNAIVTEKFKPFEGMIPEDFYIERAIAFDPTNYNIPGNENHVEEENIIYFYYIPDNTHAPFLIRHYKEQQDGTYEIAQTQQGIADLGVVKEAIKKNFTGYEFVESEVITYKQDSADTDHDGDTKEWIPNTPVSGLSGTVSVGGLEINLYYDLKLYSYTVRYLEYGTNNELLPPKIETNKKFNSTVSETAPLQFEKGENKYIYYLGEGATEEELTKTITIRMDEPDPSDPDKEPVNLITFYYSQKLIPIHYHVVCHHPDLNNLNKVSLASESAATPANLGGSVAMAGKGFEFKGWYYDEDCTTAVPNTWLVEFGTPPEKTKLLPQKIEEGEDGKEHFYALFEPICSSMMISNSGITVEDKDSHNYLYHIKGKENTSTQIIDLYVSITGNEEKKITNLPIGEYTVTLETDWSWDYSCTENEKIVDVKQNETAKVTFLNTEKDTYWLGGEAKKSNRYK